MSEKVHHRSVSVHEYIDCVDTCVYVWMSMRGSYAGRPEQRLIGSNDNFIVCDDVRCGHEDTESEERVVAIPLEAGGGHFRGAL